MSDDSSLNAQGGPYHQRGRIIIDLPIEGATWLAGELPHNDGFTRDLWREIQAAEGWVAARADEPGIVVRLVLNERIPASPDLAALNDGRLAP